MREHLQMTGYLQASTHGTNSRMSMDVVDDMGYSATFRELFCVTAHEIAKTLDTSLANLGCLYDDVLTTGTVMNRTLWTGNYGNKNIIAADIAGTSKDLEAGFVNPILFGRGQMLVLTRRVDTAEANRLQNLGYGFANIDQVSDHLARSLQISRDDLEDLVGRLHAFSRREASIPSKGVYLASFLVQPKPAMRGIDVIVPRARPDSLPMVKLSSQDLDSAQLRILSSFNGMSVDEILRRTSERSRTGSDDDVFVEKFRNRVCDLLRECPEETLHRAVFSAQQLDFTHGLHGQKESSPATVFAFCGIKEIYVQTLQSLTLKTIPLSFFQSYLRSYPGCPDHAILAQKNHKEFSSLRKVPSVSKPAPSQRSKWASMLRSNKSSISTDAYVQMDTGSEKNLVLIAQGPDSSHTRAWGGIMVTSTQDIQIDEAKDGSDLELRDLGVRANIGMAETHEQQTLADRLMSITTAFRDPHATRPTGRERGYSTRR